MGKRQEIRQQRRRERQRNLWLTIGIVAVFAIVLAGVIIYPSLASTANIIVPTESPRPQAVDTTMGDPNAPVTVEEFADFQCPYCALFVDQLEPQIISDYIATGKVYFKFVPFSFLDDNSPGRESKAAAEAAYCAMDQGSFWQYHDTLYANQNGENAGAFSNERLIAFAKKLGLDTNEFKSCLESGKYTQKVLDDIAYSRENNVTGTPSFLVNGELVSASELVQAIESKLAQAQ
ncbi:MAG: thioredoxin domain-containing protein [Chloroflexi bacterium]|nr:thioredoxin domain-containing protein [Chloroflexota bacterium]